MKIIRPFRKGIRGAGSSVLIHKPIGIAVGVFGLHQRGFQPSSLSTPFFICKSKVLTSVSKEFSVPSTSGFAFHRHTITGFVTPSSKA